MPAEAPTLLADDHRTPVYATARGEHQGGHAEPLDAVDSALRGSNNATNIIVVGSCGNRTARLCAPACQGGGGAHRRQRPLPLHRRRRQPHGALGERAAAPLPPHPVAEGENAARSTKNGVVRYDAKVIGERPAGATPPTAEIVAWTEAAVTALGYKPTREASSTDSNVPMSLGIPALTIGAGFRGGRAHALDEWIDTDKAPTLRGMQVGLAALLAMAGVD